MSFSGQYLGTVGIETEGIGLHREVLTEWLAGKMASQFKSGKIMVTRDASTESYADRFKAGNKSLFVSEHTPEARLLSFYRSSRSTMGYEVVVSPMEIPELQSTMIQLLRSLENAGDFVSPRASTHFHIGFANNLRILKNLLWMCLSLDPIMYRLGGMGGTFRGHVNKSAYARPLLNSACVRISDETRNRTTDRLGEIRLTVADWNPPPEPQEREDDDDMDDEDEDEILFREAEGREILEVPVTKPSETVQGTFAQCINPMKALEAQSIEQFWASFGISYTGNNNKYHPGRYSGINFFAVPAHGTIEFRHCNQSFDSFLVMSIAKFLRGAVELSTLLDKRQIMDFEPINSNVEISVGQADNVIGRIIHLCREKELEHIPTNSELRVIMETLEKSHFQSIPEMPVLSHKTDAILSREIVALGNLKTFDTVLAPEYLDVHNIEGKNFHIFEE